MPSNPRAARNLYLQDKAAEVAFNREQAAKQAKTDLSPGKGESVVAPTFEQAATKQKEEESQMFSNLWKGSIGATGAAVDMATFLYNKIQGLKAPFQEATGVPSTQINPDQPLGGKWMRDAFLGEHPTNAQAAGYDIGNWGIDPTMLVGGGIKLAAAAAGAGKAMMIPAIFLKSRVGLASMMKTAAPIVTKLEGLTIASPEWHALNNEIYKKTGGLFMDLSGNMRYHIPDNKLEINSKFLTEKGTLTPLPEGTTFGDILNRTDLFDKFAPEFKRMLLNIPVQDLSKTLPRDTYGHMSASEGMGLGPRAFETTPQMVMETLLHEIEHQFQFSAGSSYGSSPTVFFKKLGGEDIQVATDALKARYLEKVKATLGSDSPIFNENKLEGLASVFSLSARLGNPLTANVKKSISEVEKAIPGFLTYIKKRAELDTAKEIAHKQYQNVAGEVMARVAQVARPEGYPYSWMGLDTTDYKDITHAGPRMQFTTMPQKIEGGKAKTVSMPYDLIVHAEYQQRIMDKVLDHMDQSVLDQHQWKDPEEIQSAMVEAVDKIPKEELKTLIEQQAKDAAQHGSKFANEWAHGNYAKAIKDAGADLSKGRLPMDNPNKAFPSKGSRKELDPTYRATLKLKGLTSGDVQARNIEALGQEGLQQARSDHAAKVASYTKAAGVEAKKAVTLEDKAQTVKDTQGVAEAGAGPPKAPSPAGEILEAAGALATGARSDVWKGGRYHPEEAANRNAKVLRERLLTSSKIGGTSSKARQGAVPTFWAIDPETNQLWQVKRSKEGKLIVEPRKAKGRLPEGWMDMVDKVMTKRELDDAIAAAEWQQASLPIVEKPQPSKGGLVTISMPPSVSTRPGARVSDVTPEDVMWLQKSPKERQSIIEDMKKKRNKLSLPKK